MEPSHDAPANPPAAAQWHWTYSLPRDAFAEAMLILRGTLPPMADKPAARAWRDWAADFLATAVAAGHVLKSGRASVGANSSRDRRAETAAGFCRLGIAVSCGMAAPLPPAPSHKGRGRSR